MTVIVDKYTGRFLISVSQGGTALDRLIAEGHIIATSDPPSPLHCWKGGKWVEDDALVSAARQRDDRRELAASDADMARIGEDLINVLISKSVIAMTDLPVGAQEKIVARRAAAEKVRKGST